MEEIERLIEEENLAQAQQALDGIKDKDAHWHFLQGKIYLARKWYNEARKQFKIAVKNADSEKVYEYRAVLDDLEEFSKTPEYKQYRREQVIGGCCEGICLGC